MTRESKYRTTVEEREVEQSFKTTEVEEVEKEIAGIRCDFCTNWFEEGEVDFREFVENPTVEMPDMNGIRLYELADMLEARKMIDTKYAGAIGTDVRMPVGGYAEEIHTVKGLYRAIEEYVESRGGPRGGGFDMMERNIEAAGMNGRRDPPEEGDILFNLDIDIEVDGTTWHMCEYCVEARDGRRN